MTGDSRMFNSINENKSNGIDSITFGDNGKVKVKGLGKIVISNDMSIFNVLLSAQKHGNRVGWTRSTPE